MNHPSTVPADWRIVLINPPHTAIGSRIPDDHLPPLGLLSIGGPLLDAGFDVQLLDADLKNLPTVEVARRALAMQPQIVMLGHSGSSTAHPTVVAIAGMIKRAAPQIIIVYGGVYPTYHWDEILQQHSCID